MKISWFSNAPWARTGYGNQTNLFVPRLAALGHKMQISAFWGLEGAVLQWHGMPVYPRAYETYGRDCWSVHAKHFGADCVISLMDAWVFAPEGNIHNTPWIPWFPVDMNPLPPPVKDKVAQAFKRIVFSKFGERMVNNAGLDCYYVPHGVDTKAFHVGDRAEARRLLKFPEDAFIVGMVAANKGSPSRKAFSPQLEAFAQFKKKHSDAILYLHTTKAENGENGGVNLPELVQYLGLELDKDVYFCDQYQNLLGFPDPHMAALYNAFDVHMLVSMGEGFGIPILEAQSCGCPVIVGDWTSMSELCFSGWKVPITEADPWWTPLASYQWYPRVGAIVDALEAAYEMRGNESYRSRARDGALAYDADKVTEKYWRPTLAEIEAAL